MPTGTAQTIQEFAEGPTGQLLLQGGQQVLNGADPAQVTAGLLQNIDFSGIGGPGSPAGAQVGALVQNYIGNVASTGDVGGSFAAIVPAGLQVGMVALGTALLPPLGGLIGGALAGFISGPLQQLFSGPPGRFDSLPEADHLRWRAAKYHNKTLPSAFVSWCDAQELSIPKLVQSSIPGYNGPTSAPPWPGLSLALAQWLLSANPWGGEGYILLPGWTATNDPLPNGCHQLGIPYWLPRDAGDGWHVPPPGWWWWPAMSPADIAGWPGNKNKTSPGSSGLKSPITALYEDFGVDVAATYAVVSATGDARVRNIVYKKIAYAHTADALETAANTPPNGRTRGQQDLLNKAGIGGGKNAALAGLALVALLRGF